MKIFFWLMFAVNVSAFLGILGYSIISTDNHFWISPYYFLLPAAITFLLGFFAPLAYSSKKVVMGLCLGIAVCTALLDSFNIVVEQEAWYKRGMPERGEWR